MQNNHPEKKKGGEFSIESLLLTKGKEHVISLQKVLKSMTLCNADESSTSSDEGIPPTSQSLKAAQQRSKHQAFTSLHHQHSGSKRARTIFTTDQLERMEREFHKQQYVVGHERMYLANALNLTEAQVKVWFQNRRIKWRKQHMLSEQTRLNTLADHNSGSGGGGGGGGLGINSSEIQRRCEQGGHGGGGNSLHDPQNQLDQLN